MFPSLYISTDITLLSVSHFFLCLLHFTSDFLYMQPSYPIFRKIPVYFANKTFLFLFLFQIDFLNNFPEVE